MRLLALLVALFLPACTIVVVPAADRGCSRPDSQPLGGWQASGTGYSTPYGGAGYGTINWQGAPPPAGTHLEWGPFRRRNIYETPALVVHSQSAGRACPDSGPVCRRPMPRLIM